MGEPTSAPPMRGQQKIELPPGPAEKDLCGLGCPRTKSPPHNRLPPRKRMTPPQYNHPTPHDHTQLPLKKRTLEVSGIHPDAIGRSRGKLM